MPSYVINVDRGPISNQIADKIEASVSKVMDYLGQFLSWRGTMQIQVNVRTHSQAIDEDYRHRYGPDPTKYPDGLIPSIVDYTGEGRDQKTVATQKAITGNDHNRGNADAGFTVYLGEDGSVKIYGRPAYFDGGATYTNHSPNPAETFDFDSVALHEILHGFGFAIHSGQFKSFLISDGDNVRFVSPEVQNLLGQGIPFLKDQDHYGTTPYWPAQRGGPIQSGVMFISGDYDGNRFFLGAADLAVLQSLGWDVIYDGPMPIVDVDDRLVVRLGELGETHYGNAGGEAIFGGRGDDRIVLDNAATSGLANGNDYVDGAAGFDTVVYGGMRADYTFHEARGMVVVANSTNMLHGMDALVNIERLDFSDHSYNLLVSAIARGVDAKVIDTLVDFYIAYFNRVPDAGGIAYWIEQYQNGKSLDEIAAEFYEAGVYYRAITGYSADMPLADFIGVLYKNVLGRGGDAAPDQGEIDYWLNEVAHGAVTREELTQRFLNDARLFYDDPEVGFVPLLLDNKLAFGKLHAITFGIDYLSAEDAITRTVELAGAVNPDDFDEAVSLIGLGSDNYIA